MKTRILKLVGIAVIGVTLTACGGNALQKSVEADREYREDLAEDTLDDAPNWFLEPEKSTIDVIHTSGTGVSSSLSMARNKAILDAQNQLADQIDALVSSMTKQANNDNELGASTGMTNQVIKKVVAEVSTAGYVVEEAEAMREGTRYRVYVQLGYPVGEANKMAIWNAQRKMQRAQMDMMKNDFNELNQEIEYHRNQ